MSTNTKEKNQLSENEPDQFDLKQEVVRVRSSLKPSLFYWSTGKSKMVQTNRKVAGRFVFEEIVSLAIPLLLTVIYSAVYLVVDGVALAPIFLVLGSIISFVGAFLYGGNTVAVYDKLNPNMAKNEALVMTLFIMIPFLFGTWLIFYFGLFRLVFYFSLAQIFQSAIFVLLGFWVVRKTRIFQEFYEEVVRTEVERLTRMLED